MAIALDRRDVTIVTATGVEYAAARKAAPLEVRVVEAGIALARTLDFGEIAISCGLAGGLRADLPTGSVVIPNLVQRPDGSELECDAQLSALLRAAARRLGYEPVDAPLLTSATLVRGRERLQWADRFAAVDMESGLIAARRVACVRVVLDTPQREISSAWLRPGSVPFHPRAWRDLPFLAREGPRCARIAASVTAEALR